MKIRRRYNFRLEAIVVAVILLSMSMFIPTLQSLPMAKEKSSNAPRINTDFSITIHRIAQVDVIYPMPFDQADFKLYIFVYG